MNFLAYTLKVRFFKTGFAEGFFKVRSKVESVVSRRSLEASDGLCDGVLFDGSLGDDVSRLGTERNAQCLLPGASSL